ncbi:serine/threonine protein phosphatase [Frankia sp. CcI156]|uniref:protein phosphatase 2C domain-containing protein n=1 Tax=Frankia TaxID=1854 RepID=UPI0003CFA8F6|nr:MULTISPECIES: protein phosphatase 2C domain-containing protein [Frankia]ETA03366.1 serine/threonine protein phosphatase [Frankia sp. CcI6]OAA26622.1 serine/threonine protein phosphatase [Frankia casuarinae]OHV56226.1 serine/threonine protein phosphatase [Frankia sp. CgIS1]ONH26918.1 serine/threonine protein phosphatase [Frankia sp. CcI156]
MNAGQRPGPASGPRDPGLADPGTADPGTADPGTADPGTAGRCPGCAAPVLPDDRFCERCGVALTAAGREPGDRIDVDLTIAAGVSDRGLVHRSNEDGFALAVVGPPGPAGPAYPADLPGPARPAVVAVVCDGVSTAPGSGPAAVAAARDATAFLADAVGTPRSPEPTGGGVPWENAALRAAAAAAQRSAVASITSPDDAPACTFVAAIVTADRLAVGWLGDSRAYLLGPRGAHLLTEDDTLAAEAVRAGLLPAELAETAPGAHTITHWIGTGSGSAVPRVVSLPLTGPGRVVLCSDGLWNYASAATALAGHVGRLPADAPAAAVAHHLASVALAAGGADNITVVVIDIF